MAIRCVPLSLWLALMCQAGHAQPMRISPTAEFGTPYEIRILQGGEVVEISGSLSWAVPQNLAVVLTRTPNLREVWLDSPGGLVMSALLISKIIRERGVDTHVRSLCASACTLAFLAGTQRTVTPDARLGFHQATAPNIQQKRLDDMLRTAYAAANVPAPFINHILATRPDALWVPGADELRNAGIITTTVNKSD